MGSNGSRGGFHSGTGGNPQGNLDQEELSAKANKPVAKELPLEEGIRRLSSIKANFAPEDTIFVIEDPLSDSGLTWLENGNERAGLEHIKNGNGRTPGHRKDFATKFGVSEPDIPRFLKEVLVRGRIIEIIPRSSPPNTYDRIYEYRGKYVKIGIGSNGFIVTAYPNDGGK